MAQVRYEVGDRILDDDVLFEVVEKTSNRWGGAAYRIVELGREVKGLPKWLNPRREGSKARVVDRQALATMVHAFYDSVRQDPELGPIFEARLASRWPEHLANMVSFWSSALLAEGSFAGEPMRKHRALVEAKPTHFMRWLTLFRATLDTVFEPKVADELFARAHAMARGLSNGMFGRPFDAVA